MSCWPPRRYRACSFIGGRTFEAKQRNCTGPRRSGVLRQFDHAGLRSQRPARMARLHPDMATVLRRSPCGQSGLQRRRHVASAVAHRERRGQRHRAESRDHPDRRQQSRSAALVRRGHRRRHRCDHHATSPTPATHQAAVARRVAIRSLRMGDRDHGGNQSHAGGALRSWRRGDLSRCRPRLHEGRQTGSRPVPRPTTDAARPPLHPTAQGQQRMAEAIEPTLAHCWATGGTEEQYIPVIPAQAGAQCSRFAPCSRYPIASARSSIARFAKRAHVGDTIRAASFQRDRRENLGPSSPMHVCPAASP